jgi:hypothetical protein
MTIMKKKVIYILALFLLITVSCEQELIDLQDPPALPEACNSCPTGAGAGANVSFAKFVSIGNGFVAGFQAGALFNSGQNNSLAKIVSSQLACAGGSATFNQPDINSINGYNIQSSIPDVITLGRLVLFDPDGPLGPRSAAPYPAGFPGSAVTCPSSVTTPALPTPYNTADLPAPYGGDNAALNNFGVPLIYLGQALIPQTGGPPTSNPYYNPLYARFASNPGTSTIVGDALAAAGSFYLIWLGIEDAILYAATGASGAYPLTSAEDFDTQFKGMITTMLNANPAFKGVVGNIPSVTSLPFFTTVSYNAIPMDAATAALVNTAFAGYNAAVEGLKHPNFGGAFGSAAELDARKVSFAASNNNKILIADKTAVDFGPGWDLMVAAQMMSADDRAKLEPYRKVRQTTPNDLITLSAGAVLGTCVSNNPQLINGISVPLADQYVLLPSETTEISIRIGQFNQIISEAVSSSSNRLALANVTTALNNLLAASADVTKRGIVVDGVTLASTFAPPAGIFSEDGIHLNSRGNAFIANVFIEALNTKFTSNVPKVCLTQFSGTGLPINP